MGKQFYWSLIIFCAVLSQGIAVLSDDNIEESSSLHVRRKRVIDTTRNGGIPIRLSRAPYIVNILRNGISHCAGVILEADIVITARLCVAETPEVRYMILSNSALKNNGTPHRIERKSSNPVYRFAVLKITPPIPLHHGVNEKIDLFLGALPPNAYGYFSGWGCTSQDYAVRNRFPDQLMQTRLPIITHQECEGLFPDFGADENLHICTFDASRRRAACDGDEGGPLVYGNRLLGILIFLGWTPGRRPDIFLSFNNVNTHNVILLTINLVRGVH